MLPTQQAIPPEIASLADSEVASRARLGGEAWSYFAGTSADGVTRRENRDAYDRLRGRVLRAELEIAMALTGCLTVARIDRDVVLREAGR